MKINESILILEDFSTEAQAKLQSYEMNDNGEYTVYVTYDKNTKKYSSIFKKDYDNLINIKKLNEDEIEIVKTLEGKDEEEVEEELTEEDVFGSLDETSTEETSSETDEAPIEGEEQPIEDEEILSETNEEAPIETDETTKNESKKIYKEENMVNITVEDLRNILFKFPDQDMSIEQLRLRLFDVKDQTLEADKVAKFIKNEKRIYELNNKFTELIKNELNNNQNLINNEFTNKIEKTVLEWNNTENLLYEELYKNKDSDAEIMSNDTIELYIETKCNIDIFKNAFNLNKINDNLIRSMIMDEKGNLNKYFFDSDYLKDMFYEYFGDYVITNEKYDSNRFIYNDYDEVFVSINEIQKIIKIGIIYTYKLI